MSHPFWPLFGLRLTAPGLELRLPTDDEVVELARLAAGGIHDPAVMPFAYAWTDLPPGEFERGVVQFHWRARGGLRPDAWQLPFGVWADGRLVGCQEVNAQRFGTLHVVATGSWLGRDFQRRGLGRAMREAVLHLAFEGLTPCLPLLVASADASVACSGEPDQLRLRPVSPSDAEAVLALWRLAFPGYHDPGTPHRDPRASLERKLAHGDGLFWLAERDGRVVGTLMAGWDGHRGWLYSLAVAPAARRGGVGQALVTHAEAALRALGCLKVNLQVYENSEDARAFWRAAGYLEDPVVSLGKRLG